MITIFTIPKPFSGNAATTQKNAIRSWTLLHPKCEIILFGDEDGTDKVAAEMNVRNIPEIARNEFGTPLLSDAFEQADRYSTRNVLCYVNCDIVLFNDFLEAIRQVVTRKQRFLMIGRRWDLDIDQAIDFNLRWEEKLRYIVKERGRLHSKHGIDYFVFSKGLFVKIPSFAVGRPGWDNWMIYKARISGYNVIDSSRVVMAVHQNHDYCHVPHGNGLDYNGPEGARNLALIGYDHLTIDDANYLLTKRDAANYLLTKRYLRPTILYPLKKKLISDFYSLTGLLKRCRMKF